MTPLRLNVEAWAAALVAAVLLVTLGANFASGQPQQTAGIDAAIEQARLALQNQDADRLTEMYSPDAILITSGRAVTGRDAIRTENEALLRIGVRNFRDDEREVYSSGEYTVEICRTTFLDASGKAVITFRLMTLWKNAAGQWRIYRSILVPADPSSAQS